MSIKRVEQLSDDQLAELYCKISQEMGQRVDEKYKREDRCPECWGEGFVYNDYDHIPCYRCNTTGKYFINR